MRNSRRIKRMKRNRFTILVFFLLVNSGSVEVLDAPKEVQLPESKVEAKPRETVVIFVSPEEVLVQGESAARVEAILAAEDGATDRITARLAELKENVVGPATLAVAGRLRERVAGRYSKGTASSGAVTPHGRGWLR
jgi:hypothetical protein